MPRRASSSRLQKIEDKKNRRQAILFILLSIGFLLLLFFVGVPLLIKAAVFLGDIRASSQAIDNTDKTPPIPPRFMQDLEATNSAQISLRGYAEPGSTIKLFNQDESITELITESNGTFIFETIDLKNGTNTFSAISIDPTGNESKSSPELSIIFDDDSPNLTITGPENDQTFFGDDHRQINVSGETDEDARIRVNGFIAEVDTEGNFSKPIQLVDGTNEITVIASDEAGNQTTASISVSFSR